MPASQEFLDFVHDQLSGFRPVTMRRMFSGAGLFKSGLMFGLVSHDVLHFKVGPFNSAAYDAAGARTFTYQRLGTEALLASYREVPAGVLDDPDELTAWARAALAAAEEAAKAKSGGSKNKKSRNR